MRARTFAVVCTERNRRGWVRRLGIGPGVIRGGGAWPGVCFQRHRKDAGVLPPGGHRRHGWGCGLWRVALHLEGILPAELGTSSTRNGTVAPRGCLQNSRRAWAPASGKDSGGTAWSQGRSARSPRLRRGLSEGLGVTRKDRQRLEAFLCGVGVVRPRNPPKLVRTERRLRVKDRSRSHWRDERHTLE